jgi:hypothetical protein
MHTSTSAKRAWREGARTVFLEGPVGSGKRKALLDRLQGLLDAGQSPRAIHLIAPDHQAAQRLVAALRARVGAAAELPEMGTYYRLALTSLLEQWPDIAAETGIGVSGQAPAVLNYESAQHLMGLILAPRLAEGAFEGLRMRPQALISQLLDGLNKAAIGGYSVDEVARRMRGAWIGSADRLQHYVEAEACMLEFRSRCEAAGALDLSLSLSLFDRLILRRPERRKTALGKTRHLLVLNVEELVPLAQDMVTDWLPDLDSALLVADRDGGHRILLGANPDGAERMATACERRISAERPDSPDPSGALARYVLAGFDSAGSGGDRFSDDAAEAGADLAALREAAGDALLEAIEAPTRSGMIQAAADAVAARVSAGHPTGEICLLAPYVDGLLRFELGEALADRGIPLRTLRRFLPLRESVVVRSCICLAGLATPGWPTAEPYALAEAMNTLLPNMDPVRAARLSEKLYDREIGLLSGADSLDMRSHEQLGHPALAAWRELQSWVEAEREASRAEDGADGVASEGMASEGVASEGMASEGVASEGIASEGSPSQPIIDAASPILRLDLRLGRLFEVVAGWQPLEPRFQEAFAQLADSAERFARAAPALGLPAERVWPEFARMVEQGVVEARPRAGGASRERDNRNEGSVLLTTAHGYLVEDRRDRIQLWLDAASPDWLESPHQALTNPYVLARDWPEGRAWTLQLDLELRQQALARVLAGLARRAGDGVIVLASRRTDGGRPRDGRLWPMLEEIAGERIQRIGLRQAEA